MGAVGDSVEMHTYQIVREDEISLYGFATARERSIFASLLSASGVGPKTALAALSTLGADGMVEALATRDAKALRTIPGVGPKSADRLILELSDKFTDMIVPVVAGGTEAIEALKALGISAPRARTLVSMAQDDGAPEGDALLRKALELARA
jgi:Holliday junction DNA helicase RuvA